MVECSTFDAVREDFDGTFFTKNGVLCAGAPRSSGLLFLFSLPGVSMAFSKRMPQPSSAHALALAPCSKSP